jgi:hypothetical protein
MAPGAWNGIARPHDKRWRDDELVRERTVGLGKNAVEGQTRRGRHRPTIPETNRKTRQFDPLLLFKSSPVNGWAARRFRT